MGRVKLLKFREERERKGEEREKERGEEREKGKK